MFSFRHKLSQLSLPSKSVALSLVTAIGLIGSGCWKKGSTDDSAQNSSQSLHQLPSLPQGASQLHVASGKGFDAHIETNINYAASYLSYLWTKTGDSRAQVINTITLVPTEHIISHTGTTKPPVAFWNQGIDGHPGSMEVNPKSPTYGSPFKTMVTLGHECRHELSKVKQNTLRIHCLEEQAAYEGSKDDIKLIREEIQNRRDIPVAVKRAINIELGAQELEQEVLGIQYKIRALLCGIGENVSERQEATRILTLAQRATFTEQEQLQMRDIFRMYDRRQPPEGVAVLNHYLARYRELAIAQY